MQIVDVGDGRAVDDVQLARRLATEKNVCVVPGGLCFSENGGGDFRGYTSVYDSDWAILMWWRKGYELWGSCCEISVQIMDMYIYIYRNH